MKEEKVSNLKQSVCNKLIYIPALFFIMVCCSCKMLTHDTLESYKISMGEPVNDFVLDQNSALWKYIESLPVIDTHEHISSENELLGKQVDVFNLFTPYIIDNLQSAGMTNDEVQMMGKVQTDFDEKWNVFYKYYPLIKNSTYFKALIKALEYQYQLKSVSIEEFQRISNQMTQDYATIGFLQKIMDLNKIESILTFRSCALTEVRRTYGNNKISVVPTVSDICVRDFNSLKHISLMTEIPVRNLEDILKGINKLFIEYDALGIKNIKFGSAYNRRLNYRYRTFEEANAYFNKILNTESGKSKSQPNKYLSDVQIPLDDYLTVYMVSLAEKYEMNVIFHVGLAAWNFNTVNNSHSSDLEWLIQTFPNVNFVILHAGYPFFDEAILLAKYYPNVFLNMTWDHIIEREKSINIMKSYIEMLPLNKIHAFGGDYIFPQQIYGNMIFTKENIYFALNELINKRNLTLDDAKMIAYKWLYSNPKAFY